MSLWAYNLAISKKPKRATTERRKGMEVAAQWKHMQVLYITNSLSYNLA